MTASGDDREGSAAALRRAFDRSFSVPVEIGRRDVVDLLAIRAGGDPYALLLSEIAEVHSGRKITPVPSPVGELLGLASLRGIVVPVYDLGAILGYPPTAGPRWLALAGRADPLGVAFDVFDGHVQLPREELRERSGDESGRPYVGGTVQALGVLRPIVAITSVIEEMTRRAAPASMQRNGER